MAGLKITTARYVGVSLLLGFVLNILGWLGNVFLLGDLWDEALVLVHDTPWRATIWRELLTLLPYFVYAFFMVRLYIYMSATLGATFLTALKSAMFIFVVCVATTYFAIANSAFLPWKISIYPTILALATFIPGAWMMHRLLPHDGGD